MGSICYYFSIYKYFPLHNMNVRSIIKYAVPLTNNLTLYLSLPPVYLSTARWLDQLQLRSSNNKRPSSPILRRMSEGPGCRLIWADIDVSYPQGTVSYTLGILLSVMLSMITTLWINYPNLITTIHTPDHSNFL